MTDDQDVTGPSGDRVPPTVAAPADGWKFTPWGPLLRSRVDLEGNEEVLETLDVRALLALCPDVFPSLFRLYHAVERVELLYEMKRLNDEHGAPHTNDRVGWTLNLFLIATKWEASSAILDLTNTRLPAMLKPHRPAVVLMSKLRKMSGRWRSPVAEELRNQVAYHPGNMKVWRKGAETIAPGAHAVSHSAPPGVRLYTLASDMLLAGLDLDLDGLTAFAEATKDDHALFLHCAAHLLPYALAVTGAMRDIDFEKLDELTNHAIKDLPVRLAKLRARPPAGA